MRMRYESASDLENEAKVAELLCDRWGCQSRKNPDRYRFDFAFMRGNALSALVEIKCRQNASADFKEYMVAADKVLASRQWAGTGVKCLLVVRWSDVVGFVSCDDPSIRFGFGGRTDRGDAADMEPMAFIPVASFKILFGVTHG